MCQVHQQLRDETPGDIQDWWSSRKSSELSGQKIFSYKTLQADITKFEEDFENNSDPFSVMDNANHVNSVAGVLKSYFRRLDEALFSETYFDQFMNVTSEISERIISFSIFIHLQDIMD